MHTWNAEYNVTCHYSFYYCCSYSWKLQWWLYAIWLVERDVVCGKIMWSDDFRNNNSNAVIFFSHFVFHNYYYSLSWPLINYVITLFLLLKIDYSGKLFSAAIPWAWYWVANSVLVHGTLRAPWYSPDAQPCWDSLTKLRKP